MRSSSRIIRGLDAAELPNWSVELIGARYENPVERMLASSGQKQANNAIAKAPLTEEELRLKEWEEALIRREEQIKHLERDTLKQAEEQGQQTGYEAGWSAAHNERVALIQAAQTLEDEFERLKGGLSEKLLDLVILVSKKVIVDTVKLHPEQASELLKQVLETMQLHSTAVTLRAHPNTIRILESQFGDQQMLGNLRMIEDPKQLQGGFILQHPEGEIDMTMQTRWQRATEALGRDTPITPDELNNDSDKDSE